MITEKERRIHRHLCAILKGVKTDIVMVMHRFVVVNYQDFLPVETLRPILQSVCEDQILVLMRNAPRREWDHAIGCSIVAVNGKRYEPIEL